MNENIFSVTRLETVEFHSTIVILTLLISYMDNFKSNIKNDPYIVIEEKYI